MGRRKEGDRRPGHTVGRWAGGPRAEGRGLRRRRVPEGWAGVRTWALTSAVPHLLPPLPNGTPAGLGQESGRQTGRRGGDLKLPPHTHTHTGVSSFRNSSQLLYSMVAGVPPKQQWKLAGSGPRSLLLPSLGQGQPQRQSRVRGKGGSPRLWSVDGCGQVGEQMSQAVLGDCPHTV